MSQFVIAYLGGEQPSSAEEGKQHMASYMAWLSQLGDRAISPANPFKNTHNISPEGDVSQGTLTTMSGYTLIEAQDMDEAIGIAKACPFLQIGGTLEVSELMKMPGMS